MKDQWDLVVFGHGGTLSFTDLSQVAKRWAADDLPQRRVRAGRRTSAGLAVRHHLGCGGAAVGPAPTVGSTPRRWAGST